MTKSILGEIPAQSFIWPTRWESITLSRRDQQGKPYQMDNGAPALMWQAVFVVYQQDGTRSSISVRPVGGKVPAATSFAEIETKAIAACHESLRQHGAQ